MPDTPIIDDSTSNDVIFPAGMGRGLVPRDYSTSPVEMFAPPSEMNLIPRSEWDARIEEQERLGSSLEHIRNRGNNGQPIPILNQDQSNYCWAHSTTNTVILNRAVSNQPYVPLSAYAVASLIMNGANKGGWCGLSAKFARENGIPSQKVWPQGQFQKPSDMSAVTASAIQHKVLEDWVDLTREVYDQNLTFDQVASCMLTNVPCAVDFNWWGHSVCAVRLVRVEAGSYGLKIFNSWANWGDNGMGILRGQKAIPNGAIATRASVVSNR